MATKKFHEAKPGDVFEFVGFSASGKFVKLQNSGKAVNLANWNICLFNMTDDVTILGRLKTIL